MATTDIKLTDIKITKLTNAFTLFGGGNNTHVAAKWAINYQDKQIGMLVSDDDGAWTVYKGADAITSRIASRTAAVAWVHDNIEKLIADEVIDFEERAFNAVKARVFILDFINEFKHSGDRERARYEFKRAQSILRETLPHLFS
jgi:hypothetical protein